MKKYYKRVNVYDFLGNVVTITVPFIEYKKKWGHSLEPQKDVWRILNQFRSWEVNEKSTI